MTAPMLSVVTGTYNRLVLLKAMIASARRSFGMPLEFVVCDGGSTDGTLEWLRGQADVKVIEHGELRGAIRAFNDAALAASGDYVVLANDDVTFVGDSLLIAWRYLEDNPQAGGVAFADNRAAPGRIEFGGGYGVQRIAASPVPVVYAQVGMFRRWLGDIVGWWGHNDPVFMAQAHTYGGDNYLSARIWELGFEIAAGENVRVEDRIIPDALRETNLAWEQKHQTSAFYTRFPTPITLPNRALIEAIEEARLRVLYLPVFERGYKHQRTSKRGLREALEKVAAVIERDYVNETFDLADLMRSFRPDILLLQAHGVNEMTPERLSAARKANRSTIVINWIGDVWERCYLSPEMLLLSEHLDMMLGVNVEALHEWSRQTGKPSGYWQNAYEPAEDTDLSEEIPVLFMGNAYDGRRQGLADLVFEFGGRVYGSGYKQKTENTTYDFQAGRALYRSSKLTVSDRMQNAPGFVSNRVFEAMAAGGALVFQQRGGDLRDWLGLIEGEHYIGWDTLDDLRAAFAYWLEPAQDKSRRKIVKQAREFVEECHSFDNRVTELLDVHLQRLS